MGLLDDIRAFFKSFFSKRQKILVLGMPQSGKTTFHNILHNKQNTGDYYATPNTTELEECTFKYNDKQIILGKTKDFIGDVVQQINSLNKDIPEFLKDKNGLIIYIINCNDLDKDTLIEHAGRVLHVVVKLSKTVQAAIIYSHPDETGRTIKNLAHTHKVFSDKLEKEYPDAGRLLRRSKSYMINLIDNKHNKKEIGEIFKNL